MYTTQVTLSGTSCYMRNSTVLEARAGVDKDKLELDAVPPSAKRLYEPKTYAMERVGYYKLTITSFEDRAACALETGKRRLRIAVNLGKPRDSRILSKPGLTKLTPKGYMIRGLAEVYLET